MKLAGLLRDEKGYFRLAVAVMVIGTVLRFVLAAMSHPAGDSCWHLSVARFIAENNKIPFMEPFGITDRSVFSAPPLFHFIAAAVYKLLGLFGAPVAEFGVKLVSPFFGSLTLPFIFLLARKLYNLRIAFFATLFLAFLPLHMNSSIVSFVDSLATLLGVITIYLIFSRKVLLSALFLGLGFAAKQTMVFMLPVFLLTLFYVYRSNLKVFLAKAAVSGLVSGLVALPWLVRNYVLLGNPFWPFLYKVLGGKVVPEAFQGIFSLSQILSLNLFAKFYFEVFGAPVGSLAAVSFVHIPFSSFLVAVWLGLIVVFFLPVILGFFRKFRHSYLFYIWIASFLVATAIYLINVGTVFARFFLPAAPALGILWAFGLDKLLGSLSRLRIFRISVVAIAVLVVGCVFVFSAVETAKTVVGAKAWAAYSDDFSWIRQNTPEDAIIGYRGQCMSYNVHRFSNFDLSADGYVWVNQDFRLEAVSILEPSVLQNVETNFVPVYSNVKTGTVIYKRKS